MPAHDDASPVQVQTRPLGDGICLQLTLDRPHKRNALSLPLLRAATAALQAAGRRDDLRAVVLRGAGPAFSAGADLPTMRALADADAARSFIGELHAFCRALADVPVPTVALLHGVVLGGALEAAAACDLRIGTRSSRYGMPEVRVGLPSVIEAALLPRLVGWGRAAELVLFGALVGAADMQAWGLLNEVVDDDALDAALQRRLHDLAACSPAAVRRQKQLLRVWEQGDLQASVARSIELFGDTFAAGAPAALGQGAPVPPAG